MKQKILLGLLVIVMVLGLAIYADKTAIDYTLECKLYSVEGDLVTVKDTNGHLWNIETDIPPTSFETYFLGMNDNNTEDIKDDKIITFVKNNNY